MWNGKRGDFFLHHPYAQQQEIEQWHSTLKLERCDLLYLYGIGLGYYARSLLGWLGENPFRVLIVLEDDLGALAAFYEMEWAEEILCHPQIHLHFIVEKKGWEKGLEECAAAFPSERIEVTALHAYKNSARFKSLPLEIWRKAVPWQASLSETLHSDLFCINLLANIKRWPSSFYVNSWRDRFVNRPAVICGAGPSLKKSAPYLEQLGERALLLGGGSALPALSHLKIRPHLGVAVDPNHREYTCLERCSFRDLPLLYCGRLYAKVFELFQGPIGYIRSSTGGRCEAYFEKALQIGGEALGIDLGREAFSVTTLMVALAYMLGCDPIILVGVDLAYTDGQLYAEGLDSLAWPDEKGADRPLFRKGREGKKIKTTLKWVMESDTLSRFAKNHPNRRFFNATEGGLGFSHIPYCPLKQLFSTYCQEKWNIEGQIQEEIERSPMNISHDLLLVAQLELRKSFERSLQLCEQLLQALREGRGGQKIFLEMEIKEELAYHVVLQNLSLAITLHNRGRKGEAFERFRWNQLRESIIAFLSLL